MATRPSLTDVMEPPFCLPFPPSIHHHRRISPSPSPTMIDYHHQYHHHQSSRIIIIIIIIIIGCRARIHKTFHHQHHPLTWPLLSVSSWFQGFRASVPVSCGVFLRVVYLVVSCQTKNKTRAPGTVYPTSWRGNPVVLARVSPSIHPRLIAANIRIPPQLTFVLLYNSGMAQAQLPIVDDTPAALKMSSAVLCEKQAPKM